MTFRRSSRFPVLSSQVSVLSCQWLVLSFQLSAFPGSLRETPTENRELKTRNCISLRTFLPALPGQVFHFFLIDLEPVGFFHVLAQVRNEQSEQIVLLGFEERLADLIFLLREFLIRRYLFFQKLSDHAIAASGDRRANFTGLQGEDRTPPRHLTAFAKLPLGRHQPAGFHGRTQNLCTLL